MYQMVLFIVSNEVECVPVAWLKSETQVYWPDGISFISTTTSNSGGGKAKQAYVELV